MASVTQVLYTEAVPWSEVLHVYFPHPFIVFHSKFLVEVVAMFCLKRKIKRRGDILAR